MPTKYDEAVIALYRAPLDKFVAERKRLASELKGGGDKAGGARLAALPRPPISAWTVNQLWFEARDAFDELFAAGERLRSGDLSASHAHRDALVQMRVHAEKVLAEGGHAATEATFRRIMTNLSALAALGSFDPDPPGALSGDREPPGFDVVGMVASEGERRATGPAALPKASERARPKVDKDKDKEKEARARQERERLEQERRKKEEEERERKRVEQKRLEDALRKAKADLAKNAEEAKSLREQLAVAEKRVEQGRAEIADIESKLRGLN
jgi:hypothetical protein